MYPCRLLRHWFLHNNAPEMRNNKLIINEKMPFYNENRQFFFKNRHPKKPIRWYFLEIFPCSKNAVRLIYILLSKTSLICTRKFSNNVFWKRTKNWRIVRFLNLAIGAICASKRVSHFSKFLNRTNFCVLPALLEKNPWCSYFVRPHLVK